MASFKISLDSMEDIFRILEILALFKTKKYMSVLVAFYAPYIEEALNKLPEDATNKDRSNVAALALFRKLGVQKLGVKDDTPKTIVI